MLETLYPDILQIDVKNILANKNPSLSRILPGFAINFLRRLIHEKEINQTLDQHCNSYGINFVNAVLKDFKISYNIKGKENLPEKGRFIFASNHPLGGLDGLVLISVVSKLYGEVRFPVNDLLMNLKNFDPVFIPINKHGKYSKEEAQQLDENFASDVQILYFPSGMVSRKVKGRITDLDWKKSFITKAISHKRDIIPVYIDGKNSNFFYNFANFRTKMGIKTNLEMLLLPDEMYKQKNNPILLVFGKSIPYTSFNNTKNATEWAETVKQTVYRLQNDKMY